MAKNQKSYTPEFKQQIVDLYNAGGTSYPQLEREYGVNRSTISGWVKQLSPIKVSEEETVTLKEYKALQKEIQPTFFHEFISLFIGCGKFDLVHQSSRAAFKSSILEYPLTSGSREIRRASAMASRVFWLYAGISTAKGSPPRRTH